MMFDIQVAGHGPRNSRTFYLRISLLAMNKNKQKFSIRGVLGVIPLLIRDFR
jgi:hypothetical protein